MDNALVTLSIDMPETECLSHPVFREYARRHGLAFEVISTPRYRIRPNWFLKRRVWYHIEKFQLHDLLERYQRIVFLDTDILLNPTCPNLLETVPEGRFGCVYDDLGSDAWKRQVELNRLAARLGELPGKDWRYVNSGVMVFDQSHRHVFKMQPADFKRGRWPEQTLLNYRLIRGRVALQVLDARFNFMPDGGSAWEDPEKRASAHVVHYAGQSAKTVMPEDARRVAKGWGL